MAKALLQSRHFPRDSSKESFHQVMIHAQGKTTESRPIRNSTVVSKGAGSAKGVVPKHRIVMVSLGDSPGLRGVCVFHIFSPHRQLLPVKAVRFSWKTSWASSRNGSEWPFWLFRWTRTGWFRVDAQNINIKKIYILSQCRTQNWPHGYIFGIMVIPTSNRTVWHGQIFYCGAYHGAASENVSRPIRYLQTVLKLKVQISNSIYTLSHHASKFSDGYQLLKRI